MAPNPYIDGQEAKKGSSRETGERTHDPSCSLGRTAALRIAAGGTPPKSRRAAHGRAVRRALNADMKPASSRQSRTRAF